MTLDPPVALKYNSTYYLFIVYLIKYIYEDLPMKNVADVKLKGISQMQRKKNIFYLRSYREPKQKSEIFCIGTLTLTCLSKL